MESNNIGDNHSREQTIVGANRKYIVRILIPSLLGIIEMMYQNSGSSLIEVHGIIMLLFTLAFYVYTEQLMIRATPNATYVPIAKLICDISGVLAFSLLILVSVPHVGRFLLFLCSLELIKLSYSWIQQIFESIHGKYNRAKGLFQQILGPRRQTGSQALGGNPVEQEDDSGDRAVVIDIHEHELRGDGY